MKWIKAGKNAPVRKHLTPYMAGSIAWFTCPNCKKLVFVGEPKVVGALQKFKKQK